MFVSMQGNWTVSVKFKEAVPNSRFIISGAVSGNGTYSGGVGFKVDVTGNQWSISIQNDQTGSFRASYTQIKFPILKGGNYIFDIESNSDNLDPIFDDLILTCSTPATIEDFIIYGHVKSYSGFCTYNPCYPSYLVIDTPAALATALKNPAIKAVLTQLYPDRVIPPVIVNPNPPDPHQFTPMMINVSNSQQIPVKSGSLFRKKTPQSDVPKKASESAKASDESVIRIDSLSFEKNVALSPVAMDTGYTYDRVALASILDEHYLLCYTEDVIFETLNFQEYDRTASELAGGPYTGKGNRLDLGYAITDMNGNYIFRFKQTRAELVYEASQDVPAGGDVLIESYPDIIARIIDPSSSLVLFESAPYFNIPNVKRIDLCFPESVLNNTQVCMTPGANLIEYIGDVAIGGPQNTTFFPKARTTALNKLGLDGKITAHDPTGPIIDCGCWVGRLDLRGCTNDAKVAWYTIRYKKTLAVSWEFVKQEYHHQRVSNTNTNSPGTKVGPFLATLKVPVVSGPPVTISEVIAYKNIQGENLFGGGDWYPANIDILAQLQSGIYEAGSPGPVYFRVDAYDSSGNPLTSDMISLYIDNSEVDAQIQDAYFDTTVSDPCVLFSLTDDEINGGTAAYPIPLPLRVSFKANHLNGFLTSYQVYMGKGKYNSIFPTSDNPSGWAHGVYNPSADPGCIGYIGSANAAGSLGIVEVRLTPVGKWLEPGQNFCTFTINLIWQKRCTDGYDLCPGKGPTQFIFGLKRKGT